VEKIMEILWFILIGIVAGWLAGLVVRGRGLGIIADLVVGVIGALIGGYLFSYLGISIGGGFGALITATVGAILLLCVVQLFRRSAY
jgi:uncharacterized membrane protein YeaQ/YmgE (transglycosylase-associated protein family)